MKVAKMKVLDLFLQRFERETGVIHFRHARSQSFPKTSPLAPKLNITKTTSRRIYWYETIGFVCKMRKIQRWQSIRGRCGTCGRKTIFHCYPK